MLMQEEYDVLFHTPTSYKFYEKMHLDDWNNTHIPIIAGEVIKLSNSANYKTATVKDIITNKIFKVYFHKKMRVFFKNHITYSFMGPIYHNNDYFWMMCPKYYLGDIKSFVKIKYKNVDDVMDYKKKIREILHRLPALGYIKNVSLSLKEALERVHVLQKFSFIEIQEGINVLKFYEYTCFWHKFKNINFGAGISKTNMCNFKFPLTICQRKALKDIVGDLSMPQRKIRFLQGDVGTGKTLVSFLGIIKTLSSGFNAIFMAPTTLLARQHFTNFQEFFPHLKCELIIGGYKYQDKKEATVFFGTHALIDDKVFSNMGFLVIDEQHKFGLLQRKKLLDKYPLSDLLLLSATPIPRSLYLIKNGYINLSTLKTKPFNSKRMTKIIKNIEDIIDFVKINSKKEKILWITPSIMDYRDKVGVIERHKYLQNLGIESYFIHGQMKDEDKFKIIDGFYQGVLVATVCVETGIDIKGLNYIIIESAENFGLSTLHQLRGRVGRHEQDGTCFLINNDKNERLEFIAKTECGWTIAEEDLKMRGGGGMFHVQQWGFQQFKFGEIDELLFEKAKHSIYNKNKIDELSNYFFKIDNYFC